eukprot:PhF_6_TR26379/c0_g1_i6/m.38049
MILLLAFVLKPYTDLVDPYDSFHIRCRKFVSYVGLVGAPFAFVDFIVFAWMWGAKNQGTPAMIVATLSLGGASPLLMIQYFAVRRFRSIPSEYWVNVALCGMNTFIIAFGMCFKAPDYLSSYFVCAFLNVLCRPTKLFWHLGYVYVGFALFTYNVNVYDRHLTSTELRFPGALDDNVYYPVFGFISMIVWLVATFGFYTVSEEHTHSMTRASNTAKLCHLVAEKMLIYDVTAAQEILHNCEDVDWRLRIALMKLVSNLEMFRPHLPEYVWEVVRKQVSTSSTTNSSTSNSTGGDSLRDSVNYQHVNINSNHNHVNHTVGINSVNPVVDAVSDVKIMEHDQEQFIRAPQESHDSVESMIPPSVLSFLGPERISHVSYAIIDFRKKRLVSEVGDSESLNCVKPSSMRMLVNLAHSMIVSTNGALHTFVGDTIHASWCFQGPSEKPAQFLLQLYDTVNQDAGSGVLISGGLGTGAGTSYMAGDKRQVYVLHAHWRDRVYALYRLARANLAALVCEQTFHNCRQNIICRCIDLIPTPDSMMMLGKSDPYMNVYELLTVASTDDGPHGSSGFIALVAHDTAVESALAEDDTNAILTDIASRAVRDCAQGMYSQALNALARYPSSLRNATHSVMLDRLEQKAAKARELNLTKHEFARLLLA